MMKPADPNQDAVTTEWEALTASLSQEWERDAALIVAEWEALTASLSQEWERDAALIVAEWEAQQGQR